MNPLSSVTAVLVTRGDQPDAIKEIKSRLEPHCFDVRVHNNSLGHDTKVYGRYVTGMRAETPIVLVRDDDCIIDPEALMRHYQPGVVTVNMPPEHQAEYRDRIKLVGFGAIFDRSLIDFSRYWEKHKPDELFHRECDRIFTHLNECKVVDIGVRKLPHGESKGRMYHESRHGDDLKEIRRRLEAL